jgi:periplasmic protein TonB
MKRFLKLREKCFNMKKIFVVISIFIFIGFEASSKDSVAVYFDSNWDKCNKKKASFFRVSKKVEGKYVVTDYFITGEIQMTGTYLDKKWIQNEGMFCNYFKNGNLASRFTYKDNLYHGHFEAFREDGSLDYEGDYIEGKKNGYFIWYFLNGKTSWYEQYNMDTLIVRQIWNENGQEMDSEFPSKVEAFMAGGSRSLYFFIEQNFSYPKKLDSEAIDVEVEVFFVVDFDGVISNIQVFGSKEEWVINEMTRVFKLMPNWYPCLDHMRPINSEVVIPIKFKKGK